MGLTRVVRKKRKILPSLTRNNKVEVPEEVHVDEKM